MKFIQILDQPIEPGGLVEWSAFTPGGLGTWTADERPTSYNHESHLRGALEYRWRTRREGGRESWLGVAVEFDEPMSVPAIRATLRAWIDRHEVLRSHVVLKGTGPARLTTPPGSVQLKMGRIGWYNESGPLMDQIAGTFDRVTAPLAWPAYIFATVAREHSFTLLFAADHSLVDGYSLILAQHELWTLYHAMRTGTDPQLPPVGSYVDFSAVERRLADNSGPDHPAVAAWYRFLHAGNGSFPRFAGTGSGHDDTDPAASDPAEGAPPQSSVSALPLDDEETNRFTAVCSAAGGGLFAGVLAAAGLAYRDVTGDPFFRCVIPRHTRDAPEWLGALGWFVSTTGFTLDVGAGGTFDQLVSQATEELRRTKVAATLPFIRVSQLLNDGGQPKLVISFIDTRYAPMAAEADAGRARVLRSRSYSPDEVYVWVNRTPGGLRISARFPSDQGAYEAVSGFLETFGDIIRRIGAQSTFGSRHSAVQTSSDRSAG
ncbi:condensation domain-containing protein [Gordonia jinhuaensis]|uniref:Condensation domain-containing protein n=1 Tax=Gordonia jinhuaensis TaxID=1517702 RepID=A0A916SUL0_9ACTN|nr:condensation domain-containing protein [Gordonia jinhuaensis]GGB16663.1 hypothetical protein GCM10011489_00960 [Gordonia jinhuaensis]